MSRRGRWPAEPAGLPAPGHCRDAGKKSERNRVLGAANMIRRELVIVGAGPAGMAAAITAGRRGTRVTVIDENPASGGQIYRQPPQSLAKSPASRARRKYRARCRVA